MRKIQLVSIVLIFFCFSVKAADEGGIKWLSFQEVAEAQASDPKQVFVDVYTKWCGPCRIMANGTLKDPEVVDYINEHFYAIKFDAESGDDITYQGKLYQNPNFDPNKTSGRNSVHELTYAIARTQRGIMYPTTLYMDPELNLLSAVPGMLNKDTILMILSFFATDAYKSTPWEQYQQQYSEQLAE